MEILRIKRNPPSSATCLRELWARPFSPYRKTNAIVGEEEEDEDEEVRRLSIEPEDEGPGRVEPQNG